MKMAAFYAGVKTPPFIFAFNDADIEEVLFKFIGLPFFTCLLSFPNLINLFS